ncbi:maleylacetoacetate isomerase, partial [Burkholderia pseudomallei]
QPTRTVGADAKDARYRQRSDDGFHALRALMSGAPRTRKLGFGATQTLAGLCIVPQVFNAQRFSIGLERFPTIQRIHDHAMTPDAFKAAAPAAQPDAE